MLNNDLPRGFMLAPLLFNLYTKNLSRIDGRKFIYDDDLA